MLNYSIEMNHREKKKGGGTSIYIHNSLQYTVRRELQLGGDGNYVFIEILKTSINTKRNLICGCVYRPPFMSLKLFNEHLACVLGALQGEMTNAEIVYYSNQFNLHKNDLAKSWKILKTIICKRHHNHIHTHKYECSQEIHSTIPT